MSCLSSLIGTVTARIGRINQYHEFGRVLAVETQQIEGIAPFFSPAVGDCLTIRSIRGVARRVQVRAARQERFLMAAEDGTAGIAPGDLVQVSPPGLSIMDMAVPAMFSAARPG